MVMEILTERAVMHYMLVLYVPLRGGGYEQVLRFDGTDDYAFKNTANFDADGAAWTVETWVRPTGALSGAIWSCGDQANTTGPYISLKLHPAGVQLSRRNDALIEANENVALVPLIQAHAWNHVVFTWDNTNVRVYVNGVLAGTSATWTPGVNNTEDTAIGILRRGRSLLDDPYRGSIAQVRTYSRLMLVAEVLVNYNSGFKSAPSSLTSLTGYWNFDEGTGTTLTDLSGNSQNMTISGAIWIGDGHYRSKDGISNAISPLGALRSLQGRILNGTTSYIDCGNATELQITGAISAFVWVQGSAQASKYLFCKYDTGANSRSWAILTAATGNGFVVNLSDDGTLAASHSKQYASSLLPMDGRWHLIGFVFDGTNLRLFVDGIEDMAPTKTADDAITTLHNSTVPVTIGASFNSGVPAGFATITAGEAFVFNRPLSLETAQEIYLTTRWRNQ